MRTLMDYSYRHPLTIILIIMILIAISLTRIGHLEIDSSLEGLTVENDRSRLIYEEVIKTFGSDKINVIYVHDDALFTPEKLKMLDDLVFALEDVHGVERIESIFSVSNFKNQDGMLVSGPLMEWVPEDLNEAEQVLGDALNNPLIADNMVSSDGKSLAINIFIDPNETGSEFYQHLSQNIDKLIAPLAKDFSEIFQIGTPFLRYHISSLMLTDQMRIMPLAMAAMLFALIITTGSLSGAALPFITSSTSILITGGFMAFAGIPINLLTVIIPSLLVVVGSTEDVHLVSEYRAGIENEEERDQAIRNMISRMGLVIMVTSLTTFLGFFSITLNRITILKQFGMVAAFGLFINPLITAALAPIYFRFFGSSNILKRIRSGKKSLSARVLEFVTKGIIYAVTEGKKPVIISFIFITIIFSALGTRLVLENDILSFFKKDSPVLNRIETLTSEMPGMQTFFIRISGGHTGIFKEPDNLRDIEMIQDYLKQSGDFDRSFSILDYIKLINREINPDDPSAYAVPETKEGVSQYLTFLQDDVINCYVSHDFSDANILVRHSINSSSKQKKALSGLRKYIDQNINPHFIVDFTGDSILTINGADSIAEGQAKSIVLLLVIIAVIISILFMNIRAGLISLIPNLIPVAVNFGVMGLLGVPLNVGTAMVSVIAIGIAVDDTLHFMIRYNAEMKIVKNQTEAMKVCVRSEFRAVFATSIALCMGFCVLAFSNFVVIVQFGLLSGLVMIVAFLSDIFLTPILLSNTRLLTLWDSLSLKLQKEVIERSEFFMGMRLWQIKRIILLSHMKSAQRGEFLYREGDAGDRMYLLLEGEVRSFGTQTRTGKEVNYALYAPGDVFGYITMLDELPHSSEAVAKSDIKYVEISRESMERLNRFYPRICSKAYRNLARILGNQQVVSNWILSERGGS